MNVIINCCGEGVRFNKGMGFFSHHSSFFFLCYSTLLFYGFFCSL